MRQPEGSLSVRPVKILTHEGFEMNALNPTTAAATVAATRPDMTDEGISFYAPKLSSMQCERLTARPPANPVRHTRPRNTRNERFEEERPLGRSGRPGFAG